MHTRPAPRRHLLVVMALLAAAAIGSAAPAAGQTSGRFLAKEDILLYGLRLTVNPDHMDVPRDVAFIVSPLLQTGDDPAAVPAFAPDAELRATLRGPSFPVPIDLVVRPNMPFNIPAMKVPGIHVLDNIRLVSGGEVLIHGSPESVRLNVIDRLLVTQVTARPLTADEIREKGIVFDRSNFQAYNFAAAFAIEGNPIQINFPILLPSVQGSDAPGQGNVSIPAISAPALPNLKTIIPDTLKLQTQLPNLSVVGFTLKVPKAEANNFYVPPIPGIVAIPGDIGFLNQYFSVMLMVGNGAPTGSNLVVSDLSAEIKLPVSAKPALVLAQTTAGQSPAVQLVRQPGADGKLGTADDINTIGGGESGQAEFLVEGRREGSHVVQMQMTGTLLGLPGGPVAISGTAAGSVLVRNPAFSLTFTHPEVVTAGEPYTLDVTITNTSQAPANFVSLSLHPQHVGGADVIGAPSHDVASIAPGDSATVSFTLKAKVTGKVTAATLDADDNVSGRFALKTSVGELGVPLSPDSLVLPKESSSLPAGLRSAAIGLLGKAWAVATAPAAAVPRDLQRFSKKIVLDRAVEVAEAGLRKTLHEPLVESAAQLLFDVNGSNYSRLPQLTGNAGDLAFEQNNFTGFDLLRRKSMRGDAFADAVAGVMSESLGTMGGSAFHARLGEIVTYRPGHISVLAYTSAGALPVHVELTDPQGRRLGGLPGDAGKIVKDAPFSDYLTFTSATGVVARMALVASPVAGSYALRFVPTGSGEPASFNVSILIPGADGLLHHLVFNGVTASSVLQLPAAAADPYRLTMTGTPTVTAVSNDAIADDAPSVISVIQQENADLIICDEDDVTGPQVGRIVAVLFSEEVTRESVQDRLKAELITNFLPDGNAVVGVALQPGRRIAFLALRDPFGPLVPRALKMAGIKDLRDHAMSTVTVPMQATVTDPGGRISGRVLAADGTPVAYASVRLFYLSPCDDMEQRWIGVSAKTTDGNGFYSWDYVNKGMNVRIVAVEPGTNDFRDVRFGLTGQEMTVNIVFLGRGTLQGRALKEDRATPLAGTVVRVTSLTDRSQYGATTDSQGRFTIARVPVGNVFIEAVHAASKAAFSGSELIPFAGATTNRDLVLLTDAQQPIEMKRGKLSGYVLRGDGVTTVAGAPVIVYYQSLSQPGIRCPQGGLECAVAAVNSGADGKFTFDSVVAGSLRLQTFDANSLEQGETGVVVAANGTASANILLVAGLGTVKGKVVDAQNHGIANASVGGGLSLTTTNGDGEFELKDVPVGRREIVAVSQAAGSRGSTFVDIVRGGETVFATIVLDPVASVSGVVRRSNGAPAVGIKVYVIKRDSAELIQVLGQAETSGSGGYQIDRIPVGEYLVSAFAPDFSDGNIAPVKVRFNGEVARADIKFRGGNGKVTGKVLGDNATPLKARVSISGDQVVVAGGLVGVGFERRENFRIVDTAFTTGSYSISGVFVGPFTLRAAGQFSPDPIVVEQTMPSANGEVEVNLTLQPTSSLKGTIYAPDGTTPVGAGVSVQFHSDAFVTFCRESAYGERICESIPQGVQEAFATTDANGQYLFPIINPGSFTVTVEHDNGWIGVAKGTVTAGQAGIVDMRLLGRASVKVLVQRSDLSPVNKAKVQITRLEAPRRSVTGQTGVDGTVVFSGADAFNEGEFIVEATDVDGTGAMARGRGVVTADGVEASATVSLLSASGSVRGRLVKTDGFTAVANAEVVVNVNGKAMAFALTNAQGDYSVPGVPLGAVTVDAFEAATARRAFGSGTLGVNGDQVVIDLMQRAMGMVRGRVFDARTLEPLRNWRVTLNQQSASGRGFPALVATSEIDGGFSFPGASVGSFSIAVQKTGVVGSGSASGTVAAEGQVVEIAVPVNIPRPSFGTITGLVRMPNGAAAANARVEVFMRGATVPVVVTADGDGKFEFGPTEIGRFRANAKPQNGSEFGSASGELSVDGDRRAVTIDLNAVTTISGVVMDGSAPAGNVRVALTGSPSSGCQGACTQSTDGTGHFTFTNVPATTFTIVASTLDESRKGSVGDTLSPGTPKSVTIVLEPSRRLGALVRFTNGDPAPGVIAEVIMGTRHFFAETGADGTFTFAALPLAQYKLVVRDPVGDGLASVTGTLVADITLNDITLDQDPPSVANLTPGPASTAVPPTTNVVVRFSEPIDRARVDHEHFQLIGPSGPVDVALDVSADDREVTLDPRADLAAETRYRVAIAGVQDRVGKEMAAEVVATFTTKDITAPSIAQYTPGLNANGVNTGSVVRIRFSEAIDPTKFTTTPIVVRAGGATGAVVAGGISYGFGNTVVVFTPTLPLSEDIAYSVSIAEAYDIAGNRGTAGQYVFTTSDRTPPAAPVLQAMAASVIENAKVRVQVNLPPQHDVQFVDFYVNGALSFTAVAPFVYDLQAVPAFGAPGQSIAVTAIAADTSGNRSGLSAALSIPVVADQPPAVAIQQPASGTTVKTGDLVKVRVHSSDDLGVKQVVFRAKVGTWQTTLKKDGPQADEWFEFVVPSSAGPSDTVTLEATALDAKGSASAALPVTLTVLDTAGPSIEITGATTGASVKPGQQTTVVVTAQDPGKVKTLTFKASGAAVFQTTRAIAPPQDTVVSSFTFTVGASARAPEKVTLEATATDAAGNVAAATVVTLDVADVSAPSIVTLRTSNDSTTIVPGSTVFVETTATDDIEITKIALNGTGAFGVTQFQTYSPGHTQESHTFAIVVPQELPAGAVLNLQARATDRAGNVSQPALLTLTANTLPDVTLPSAPFVIKAGKTLTTTFTLSAPAPAGGTKVAFTTESAGIAEVTPSVTVPAGQTSGSITIAANAGGSTAVVAKIDSVERGRATTTVLGGVVSGTVFGPDGGAAIGATVTVTSGSQSFSTQTDGDGFFEVQGATGTDVKIKAFAAGLYGTASGTMTAHGYLSLNVQIIDAGPVTGVVKLANDTPAGANVRVSIYVGSTPSGTPLQSVFTADDSTYEFALVDAGIYTLEAYGANGNRARSPLTVVPGIEANVPLKFLGRTTVHGEVHDGVGNRVSAEVTLSASSVFGNTSTSKTTADGIFQFDDVFVGSFTVSAKRTATGEAGQTSGDIDVDGQPIDIVVTLAPIGTLEGAVLRGTTPVANAKVTVGGLSTRTSAQGRYELIVPAGDYTATATVDGTFEIGQAAGAIAAGQRKPQDITLEPQGTLVVTVKNFDDSPAQGVTVSVTAKRNGIQPADRSATTTSSGVAIIEHVIAGSYTVTAGSGALKATATGTLAPQEQKPVSLKLQGLGAITGTVYLPVGGQKATSGKVSIRGYLLSSPIGADGRYRIENVPLSTNGYTLDVNDTAQILRAQKTGLKVESATEDVIQDFTMVGVGTVTGRVVSGSNGANNALVTVRSLTPLFGNVGSARTDGAGTYTIPNVVVGDIYVTAELGTSFAEASNQLTLQNTPLTVNLSLVPNSQTLPVSKQDANNALYDIQRGINLGTQSRGFYNAFLLDVTANGTTTRFNGASTTGTSEDGGRELVNRQAIAGLNVTRKVFIPRTGYFGRWLEILSNPTDQAITVDVKITNGMGWQNDKRVVNVLSTSSGDAVLDVTAPATADTWIVMDDSFDLDPASSNVRPTAVIFDGPGAATRVSQAAIANDPAQTPVTSLTYEWRSVTVPAGATVAYMHFGVVQWSRESALASAQRLVQLPPEALVGLSLDELQWVRNFAMPGNGQSTVAPFAPLNGTITGKLIANDRKTIAKGQTSVTLRSDSLFFPRTYSTTIMDGAFSFAGAFVDNGQSLVVPTGSEFTLQVNHPQTGVPVQLHSAFDGGQLTAVKDLVFDNTSMISGVVRRHTGGAIGSGFVDLTMPELSNTVRTTVVNGNYLISGIPVGTYTVKGIFTASPNAFELTGGFSQASTANGEVTRDITLIATGGVTGHLTKGDHSSPVNYRVELTNGTQTVPAFTNTSGDFTFSNVPIGNWTLDAVESNVHTRVPVAVVADTVTRQDINMIALRDVTVTVRYPDSTAPGIVPVVLSQAGQTDKSGSTNASGQVTFNNVPGGVPFTVRAWTSSLKVAWADSAPQTITEVGPALPVAVTLPAMATLRVTVTQGPDEGANLRVLVKDAFHTSFVSETTTNADGQASIAGVAQGPVEILVRNSTPIVLGGGSATIQSTDHAKTVEVTVAAGIVLPKNLDDANGFRFDLQKEGNIANGTSRTGGKSYNAAAKLTVTRNGQPVALANTEGVAMPDATGRQLSLTRQAAQGGLTVTRKIFVPTDGYFARYVDSVTNTGNTAITIDLQVATDPDSDAATRIVDQVPSQYMVTDDDNGTAADPTLAHVFGGSGGRLLPVETQPAPTTGLFTYAWNGVTIDVGETVSFMHFAVQQNGHEAAKASAQRLVQLAPEAIAGLTVDERRAIHNFAVPEDGSSTVPPLVMQRITTSGQVFGYNEQAPITGSTTVSLKSLNPIFSVVATTAAVPFTLTNLVADGWTLQAVNTPPAPFNDFTTTSQPVSGVIDPDHATVTQNVVFANAGGIAGVVRFGNQSPVTSGTLTLSFGVSAFNSVSGGVFMLPAVPPGTYTATSTIDDRSERVVTVPFTVTAGQSTPVVLEFPALANLAIAITNPDGSPAPFSKGTLTWTGGFRNLTSSTMGASGSTVVTAIPEGPFTIEATSQDSSHFGRLTGVVAHTDEGRNVAATTRLIAIAKARVVVTRGGQPLENASIMAKPAGWDEFGWFGSTDAQGEALLEGLTEGQFIVQVVGEGNVVLGTASGVVGPQDDGQTLTVNIPVATNTSRLSGQVFAADGETPALLSGTEGSTHIELLDAVSGSMVGEFWSWNGEFDFPVVPQGTLRVRATSPLDSSVQVEKTVALNGDQAVTLTLPLSVVKGTVTRPGGVPVQAYVRVETDERSFGHRADENGRFAFVGVPAGALTFEAFDDNAHLVKPGNLPGAASVVSENLVFNVVKGRVTYHGGEAVVQPSVFVTQLLPNDWQETYYATVDDNGNYEIVGVQPGPFTVTASMFGLEGTVTRTMTDNSTLENVDVTLEQDGTITGTFKSADGVQTIGGATVVLTIPNVERQAITDAAAGTFTFPHVKLGAFSLHAKDPSSGLVASLHGTLTTALPNRSVVLQVPATGTVTGQVLAGAPPAASGPAEVIVENFDNDGPLGSFSKTVTTDATGAFQVTGVPVGAVRVSGFIGTAGGRASGTLTASSPLDVQVTVGDMIKLESGVPLASSDFVFDVTCSGGIGHGGKTDGTWQDTYQNAFQMSVDGVAFPCVTAGTFEDGRRELAIEGGRLDGLAVTRKIFVPATGGFVRYLEVLSNPGQTAKTAYVSVAGTLPRPQDRLMLMPPHATGNTFAVLYDRIRGGQGFAFANPASASAVVDLLFLQQYPAFAYSWEVTVPAGQTRILMHFAQQAATRDEALAGTEPFTALTRPDMLSGMSQQEKSEVVNFTLP